MLRSASFVSTNRRASISSIQLLIMLLALPMMAQDSFDVRAAMGDWSRGQFVDEKGTVTEETYGNKKIQGTFSSQDEIFDYTFDLVWTDNPPDKTDQFWIQVKDQDGNLVDFRETSREVFLITKPDGTQVSIKGWITEQNDNFYWENWNESSLDKLLAVFDRRGSYLIVLEYNKENPQKGIYSFVLTF